MNTLSFLLLSAFCFIISEGTFAQSGATGTSGGDITNLGYINYTAALGKDQQIASGGNVTIGASGNMDIYGALQVDNGGTLELLTGAVLNVYGNVTINGTLAIATGATINYYGKTWTNGSTASITNDGTLTGTPGNAVNFITPQLSVPGSWTTATAALSSYSGATQSQNLDGSGNTVAMNIVLHVQNASTVNLVNTPTSISGQLSFDIDNGYVVTNSNNFIFTSIASHTGSSPLRYIQTNTTAGEVIKKGLPNGSSFFFPVGFAASSYTPANVAVTTAGTDNYHVNVNNFATSPPNEVSINPNVGRTWLVYSDATASSVTLNFVHYKALEAGAYNDAGSSVYFLTDVGNWRPKDYGCLGETVSPYGLAATYYAQQIKSVELPTCQSCSTAGNGTYYTKSSCGDIILAVELISFHAAANNCAVNFNWQTGEEVNSSHYTIEQSTDAITFTPVATVNSHNINTGSSYTYTQNNVAAGTYYYRLKMVDKNNSYSYSNVAPVKSSCSSNGLLLQAYPNPVSNAGILTLKFTVPATVHEVHAVVTDATGRQFIDKPVTGLLNNTTNIIEIPSNNLAAGTYFIRLLNKGWVSNTIKFVRQ